MHRPLQPTHGFTLIELLVVVSVISILASMLVPAAVRGMRSSATAHCKSNFNQLHHGFQIYGTTFQNSLPPFGQYYRNDPDDTSESYCKKPFWTETISHFLYPDLSRDDALNKAVRCPMYNVSTSSYGRGVACNYGRVFRYVIDRYGYNGTSVNSAGSMKFVEFVRPSGLILIMDGATPYCYSPAIWERKFDRDNDGLTDSYHETGLKYNGGDPLRHDGSLNALFADGHIDLMSLRDWITADTIWDPLK